MLKFFKCFKGNNNFIITQDPMQNTIFEFWKMISEYNCQIIVSLNRNYSKEDGLSINFPLDDEKTKIFEFEDLKFCISVIDNENDDPLSDNIDNNSIIKKEYEVIETKV
jgi:protein tyrosine phosphatase